jgi:hypothetical protein
MLQYTVEDGALTEEELDDYTEAVLGYSDEDTDVTEDIMYDKIAKYDKKIADFYSK